MNYKYEFMLLFMAWCLTNRPSVESVAVSLNTESRTRSGRLWHAFWGVYISGETYWRPDRSLSVGDTLTYAATCSALCLVSISCLVRNLIPWRARYRCCANPSARFGSSSRSGRCRKLTILGQNASAVLYEVDGYPLFHRPLDSVGT
jgi:drug/metabolite transporter superfamily protein YnfA